MSQELSKFDDLKAELATLVAPTKELTVFDFESSQRVLDVAKKVKDLITRVDKRRRELVKPLQDEESRINAYAKDIALPLREAEAHLGSQLNAFAAENRRKELEALRLLEEERRAQEEELRAKQAEEAAAEAEAIALFGAEPVESETVAAPIEVRHRQEIAVLNGLTKGRAWDVKQHKIKNTRAVIKVRVLDLSLVPDNLIVKELNDKAAIAMHKAGVTIPGLEFYEEVTVPIASKTRVSRAALTGRDEDWKP